MGFRQKMLHSLRKWWGERSFRTRKLPAYIQRAAVNFARSGSQRAAALAYYAIFAIFPLALLLAVVIGNIVEPAVAQEQITQALQFLLPDATISTIRDILGGAIAQGREFGIVALIGLIWSASNLFNNIAMALDQIFRVPSQRSIWRQRLVALLMGLILVALVLASFLTSGVLRLVSAILLNRPSTWLDIATVFLPLGLNLVIFALLFRHVPAREVHWDAIWPAAIFGAVGWEITKSGFDWYLSNLATYTIIYGSIATGIVILFWAFLVASVFLFSAELCARLDEWLEDVTRQELKEEMQHAASSRLQDRILQPPVS